MSSSSGLADATAATLVAFAKFQAHEALVAAKTLAAKAARAAKRLETKKRAMETLEREENDKKQKIADDKAHIKQLKKAIEEAENKAEEKRLFDAMVSARGGDDDVKYAAAKAAFNAYNLNVEIPKPKKKKRKTYKNEDGNYDPRLVAYVVDVYQNQGIYRSHLVRLLNKDLSNKWHGILTTTKQADSIYLYHLNNDVGKTQKQSRLEGSIKHVAARIAMLRNRIKARENALKASEARQVTLVTKKAKNSVVIASLRGIEGSKNQLRIAREGLITYQTGLVSNPLGPDESIIVISDDDEDDEEAAVVAAVAEIEPVESIQDGVSDEEGDPQETESDESEKEDEDENGITPEDERQFGIEIEKRQKEIERTQELARRILCVNEETRMRLRYQAETREQLERDFIERMDDFEEDEGFRRAKEEEEEEEERKLIELRVALSIKASEDNARMAAQVAAQIIADAQQETEQRFTQIALGQRMFLETERLQSVARDAAEAARISTTMNDVEEGELIDHTPNRTLSAIERSLVARNNALALDAASASAMNDTDEDELQSYTSNRTPARSLSAIERSNTEAANIKRQIESIRDPLTRSSSTYLGPQSSFTRSSSNASAAAPSSSSSVSRTFSTPQFNTSSIQAFLRAPTQSVSNAPTRAGSLVLANPSMSRGSINQQRNLRIQIPTPTPQIPTPSPQNSPVPMQSYAQHTSAAAAAAAAMAAAKAAGPSYVFPAPAYVPEVYSHRQLRPRPEKKA